MAQGDLDARTSGFRQLPSTDAAASVAICRDMEQQWEVVGMPKGALLSLSLSCSPVHDSRRQEHIASCSTKFGITVMCKSSLDSQQIRMCSATWVGSCASPGINSPSGTTWPSSCCFIGQLQSEFAQCSRPQASKFCKKLLTTTLSTRSETVPDTRVCLQVTSVQHSRGPSRSRYFQDRTMTTLFPKASHHSSPGSKGKCCLSS